MIINPLVAERLEELCDSSKPFLEDDTVNEDAAGADEFCRWAVVGFTNGHWQRFQIWLVDFAAENRSLRNIKEYYLGIIQDMEKLNTNP